jgi:hypothetical protein
MKLSYRYEEYLAKEIGCNFTSSEYCVILKKALYAYEKIRIKLM